MPNTTKNQIAIVTAGSAGFGPAIGTLLLNLTERVGHEFDFYIFSEGISEGDLAVLRDMHPQTFYATMDHCRIGERLAKSKPVKWFTPYVLAKFEVFRLAAQYKKAVWLDFDLLVTGHLGDLLDVSARENNQPFVQFLQSGPIHKQLRKSISGLDLMKPAVATGTFTLSGDAPWLDLYNRMWDLANLHADCLYLPEQAVITMALEELNLTVDFLENQRYLFSHAGETGPSEIRHFYGPKKPWKDFSLDRMWTENYRQWQRLGGSSLELNRMDTARLLTKLWHRAENLSFVASYRFFQYRQQRNAK